MPPGLEGVDPSFLEALPEHIRREVIAEQLRLARVQNQISETVNTASSSAAAASTTAASNTAGSTTAASTTLASTTAAADTSSQAAPSTSGAGAAAGAAPGSLVDVSAEFLAALPPAIQEEVRHLPLHTVNNI